MFTGDMNLICASMDRRVHAMLVVAESAKNATNVEMCQVA